MSRRQKGPTPEELIEKLQANVDEYKLKNDETIENFKTENKSSFNQVNDFIDYCKSDLENIKSTVEIIKDQNRQQVELFEEKHSKDEEAINETNESVTDLQKQLEEVKQRLTTVDTKLETAIQKLEEQGDQNMKEINLNMNTENENNKIIKEENKQEIKQDMKNILEVLRDEQTMNQNKFLDVNKIINDFNQIIQEKMEENFNLLIQRIDHDAKHLESSKDGQDVEMDTLKDQVRAMIERVDDISEKMYEFEQNKKNNLLFYGIANDTRETPTTLLQKISSIMRTTLSLRREIALVKANRILTGPEILGSRPVVVTFETYKDKEDVLRKAGLLRGSNIHVTEDMNKKTRESRTELRRFMRSVKRNNPAVNCTLNYDKLFMDNKVFVWNDIQGKVVEQLLEEEANGTSPCPCSRPASVMTDSGYNTSMSSLTPVRSPMKSPKKSFNRTQSLYNYEDEEIEETIKEREDKIRELEDIIASQASIMKQMKSRLDNIENDNNDMSAGSTES